MRHHNSADDGEISPISAVKKLTYQNLFYLILRQLDNIALHNSLYVPNATLMTCVECYNIRYTGRQ